MDPSNQNQWLTPQSMSSTGSDKWFSQALRGPPLGFSPKPTCQPQAHLTGTSFDAPHVTS